MSALKQPWPLDPWKRNIWFREHGHAESPLFPADQMDALCELLGTKFPLEARRRFVIDAERRLIEAKEHWRERPNLKDREVFERIAKGAEALQRALQELDKRPQAREWFSLVWEPVVSKPSPPDPLVSVDDLAANVAWLLDTANELLPDGKRYRPLLDDLAGFATLLLAEAYFEHFRKRPARGEETPFYRFTTQALGHIGCTLPHRDRLKRIFDRAQKGASDGAWFDPTLSASDKRVIRTGKPRK